MATTSPTTLVLWGGTVKRTYPLESDTPHCHWRAISLTLLRFAPVCHQIQLRGNHIVQSRILLGTDLAITHWITLAEYVLTPPSSTP